MFGIKTSVSKEWKARLANVQVFNQYARDNRVEFKSVVLEGFVLEGAEFSTGAFVDTDWKDAGFQNSRIENATFDKGVYRSATFSGSVLRNVTFSNITFHSADFGQTELDNVRFIKCNFGRAAFHGLENSTIEFQGSVLEEVRFFNSDADIKFIDSKLTEVSMMGTTAKEYLIVKDSDIYAVDLTKSVIPYVEITDSKVERTVFGSGKAKSIVMKNLKGALNTDGAVVDGNVLVENIETEVLNLTGTVAQAIHVRHVVVTDTMLGGGAEADRFEISDSNIKTIWNGGSILKHFKIINTELRGTRNEGSKIDTFHLENVVLNGKFNFEYTHAQKLELVNVTKGPNFEFRGKEGNIAF